jgi:hypothetical protein
VRGKREKALLVVAKRGRVLLLFGRAAVSNKRLKRRGKEIPRRTFVKNREL